MNPPADRPDLETQHQIAARLPDLLIRAGLSLALIWLCYRIFSPFLTLMIWAVILAVTLFPLQQWLAARMRGKQGLAATVLVVLGILLLVVPTAVLLGSLGDSIQQLVQAVQNNSLQIPAPRPGVAEWPLVGARVHAIWSQAYADLPALVKSLQPKIGDLAKGALGFVAGIGGGVLQFLAALVIAGIIMAFGDAGDRTTGTISARIAGGGPRGAKFQALAVATIRAVALGVIGVAFIQAIIIGLCLLVAGVPWAGALSLIALLLGIAQVPALVVTLPAIVYIWSSGDYGTVAAGAYTALLFVAGMTDNVLKPLMLGRGVEAPMPVILLGALGGMATAGILGMFLGATLLAMGYQIFMAWVANDPQAGEVPDKHEPPAAS